MQIFDIFSKLITVKREGSNGQEVSTIEFDCTVGIAFLVILFIVGPIIYELLKYLFGICAEYFRMNFGGGAMAPYERSNRGFYVPVNIKPEFQPNVLPNQCPIPADDKGCAGKKLYCQYV